MANSRIEWHDTSPQPDMFWFLMALRNELVNHWGRSRPETHMNLVIGDDGRDWNAALNILDPEGPCAVKTAEEALAAFNMGMKALGFELSR